MAKVGQKPDASGGGNQRRRVRLVIQLPDSWTVLSLADELAAGFGPLAESENRQEETET